MVKIAATKSETRDQMRPPTRSFRDVARAAHRASQVSLRDWAADLPDEDLHTLAERTLREMILAAESQFNDCLN